MGAKKIGFVLALIMPLVLASLFVTSVIAPTFEESTATATVIVNTFVDITITDRGASGLSFGSLDPATNNNPEAAQDASFGAVNFKVESTTNKGTPVNVRLNATNFTSGATNFTGNVTADDDNAIDTTEFGATQLQLTSLFATLTTLSPGASTEIWYWMDVPSAQAALTYTSTFGFRGD